MNHRIILRGLSLASPLFACLAFAGCLDPQQSGGPQTPYGTQPGFGPQANGNGAASPGVPYGVGNPSQPGYVPQPGYAPQSQPGYAQPGYAPPGYPPPPYSGPPVDPPPPGAAPPQPGYAPSLPPPAPAPNPPSSPLPPGPSSPGAPPAQGPGGFPFPFPFPLPGAGPSPQQQTPSSGAATPVDPNLASVAAIPLAAYAQQETPGMQREGMLIAGNFKEGQTLEQPFQLLPNKCYAVVAMGAGPSQVDLSIVAVTPIPQASGILAQAQGSGHGAVLGGRNNCFRWDLFVGINAKYVIRATRGQGLIAAQLYSK